MAYDDFDRTATIEKEDTSILDLIDERLSENEEVKRQERPKIESKQSYEEPSFYEENESNFEPFEFTATSNKRAENVIETPFFGDSDAITKLRDKRNGKTATSSQSSSRPQARAHIAPKRIDGRQSAYGEMSARRKRMWIATGSICAVLLVGFMISNIISLTNLSANIENMQSNIIVKERELTSLEGQIINNSSTIPNGMVNAESQTIEIDASDIYPTEIHTSDNTFNRIAKFISYLLGK